MCVSCGCTVVDSDHGDAANITQDKLEDGLTEEELKAAADAQGLTVEEVMANIEKTAQ